MTRIPTPERLAEIREYAGQRGDYYCDDKLCDMTVECLDAIEALQADNERMREALEDMCREFDGFDRVLKIDWADPVTQKERHRYESAQWDDMCKAYDAARAALSTGDKR